MPPRNNRATVQQDSAMQKLKNRVESLETNLQSALPKGSENSKLFLDLGRAHYQLYENSHQAENLENSIKHFNCGLEHPSLEDVHRDPLVFNLGTALMTRFQEQHNVQDLHDAITSYERVLELRPIGHQGRQLSLFKVANARATRFYERKGDIDDLQEAINCFREALSLCPVGHPGRLSCLRGLARSLTTRFLKLEEIDDLQEAIVFLKEALELCPNRHPERSTSLSNLARGLLTRFRKLADLADLQEATSLYEQALRLRPGGHPGRAISLRNLAGVLLTKFTTLGEMKDLQAAIEFQERGLRLCPDGHSGQAPALEGLAGALMVRFKKLDNIQDLDRAVGLFRKASELHPINHSNHLSSLEDLGDALFVRFKKQEEISDLEEAITLFTEALTFHSSQNFDYDLFLAAVSTLLARYNLLWNIEDLNKAVIHCEQGLKMCPIDHPVYLALLSKLSYTFITRFKNQRDIEDLQKSMNLLEKGLELIPQGGPERPTILNKLMQVLLLKFGKLKNMEDLQRAMASGEEAISLCSADDPNRVDYLYELAHALKLRVLHLKDPEGLEQAIDLYKEILILHPDGHPERPVALENLAAAFQLQFTYTGNMSKLESAESHYRAALLCLPPDHPYSCKVMLSQASLIIEIHESDWIACQDCSHIDDACKLLKTASYCITSTPQMRFKVSLQWADIADTHKHESALAAYSTLLELQQEQLAILPPPENNPRKIVYSLEHVSNATSYAIKVGNVEAAVQFMEQGRSILWATIRKYRPPFEKLLMKDSALASEFRSLGNQIRHYTPLKDVNVLHQQALYEQWTNLLKQVRQLDGFSNYLQALPLEVLKDIVKEGPIIMLDIDEDHSNAIILTASATPIITRLHDATSAALFDLVEGLSKATSGTRSSKDIVSILQHLWEIVVQPIVNQLALLQIPEKSHIWWCPTSCFSSLPLHAAGPYKKGLKNMPDLYISSYTSNLESLIEARKNISKPQSTPSLLLVSPENSSTGMMEETGIVERFGKDIKINICAGNKANKETIITALQSCSWVHFCCYSHLADYSAGHGVFRPWFQLHDKEPLSVHELAKAQLSNANFAFLSACLKAEKSVFKSPNLFTNFTTALQFSGFKGVVGTLWETVDDDGPVVASFFYKHMFHNPESIDVRDAAKALNAATREMRKQGVPIDQWINYIHVGI